MVPHRPLPFARRADRRVVAGVAGGFADTYGVDPVLVRGALVLMALAGGLGLVVYALGFAWAVEAERATVAPASRGTWRDGRRTVAFACIATGGVLVGRGLGLWFGDPFMIAAVAVVAGLGVLGAFDPGGAALVQAPVASRVRVEWRLPGMTEGRHARLRILGGALLVAIGLVVVGGQSGVPGRVRQGVFATACTFVGVAVLLGPWIARAARDVAEERRRRIRSDERAAMAAHLHDSVLQTLALIQRSAADPRRTVTLARRQERELRTWLYGGDAPYETLAAALRSMAADVEASYDVAVDAVVAGDRPMDDVGAALVAAAREACVNAAKHAGVGEVSVFVEIGVEAIDAFVRDRGRGFDRGAVAPDRRGISESIEGRVHRAGGITEIESIVGKGTEVHLRLPIVDGRRGRDVRVFLVDDHALFRAGVRAEIGSALDVVGEAGTVEAAVPAILAASPDVVVVDVHLPGGGGRAIIEAIKRERPHITFLALSVSDSAEDVVAVIRAGARGYVTKTIEAPDLIDAVRRVHAGDAVFSPRLAGFVLDAFSGVLPPASDPEMDQLTPREQDVMRLIARGYTYREVATRLHLSVKTIETHVSAVLRKLQLSNRHELTAWAANRRLL